MANIFAFVGSEPDLVQVGSVIDLAVRANDSSSVEGYIEGKKVGVVVNEPNLISGKTITSVECIRDSVISHPQCAAAKGLILSDNVRRQGGKDVHLYVVEMYVIPKREKKKKTKSDALRYRIAGGAAQNPKKANLLGELQQLVNDGKQLDIPVLLMRIGNEYKVVRLEEPAAGAAAGQVKQPDEILSSIIPDGDTYPATVVELQGREYVIEISPESKNMEEYYPIIDEAVSRCAGQSKEIEAKVQTMLDSRFDRNIIEAAVSQMPSLGLARRGVPRPKTKYTQRTGSNLSDLTCYMLAGKMVRLVGEKGSGKNTLVETACWLLNRPLCRVQGSSELDKLDLLGSRTLKGGSTGFELSEFLQTLKDDGVAVIDEANTVRPEVLTILHSLTDGARAIDVPGYGTVRMGPHACILYTMNEDYVGTGEMNAATIDRGPSMIIEQESNMKDLLRRSVPGASDQDINACCKVSDEIRNAAKNGSGNLSPEAITVRGYIDALQCVSFIPLRRALIQNVANKAQSASERMTIEQIIIANIA